MKIKPFFTFVMVNLIILYVSVAISVIYDYNCKEIKKASSYLYDENAITFITSKTNCTMEILKEKLPSETSFFLKISGMQNIRGIYYKGNFSEPKMKEGRFFVQEDFDEQKHLAVIGSEVSTKTKNGQTYIEYGGENYKVIGIMGYPMPTKLENAVFLSLNDILLKENADEYIISGNHIQDNYDFLGNVNVFGEVIVYDNHEPDLFHVVNLGSAQIITVFLFIFCILFNMYIVIYFWIEKEKKVYLIKIINGYTHHQLKKEELKKFLISDFIIVILGMVFVFCIIYKKLMINLFILLESSFLYLGISFFIFYFLLNLHLKQLK